MLTKEILCAYLPYEVKAVQSHNGKDELYSLYGIKYSEYAKEWTVFIDDSRHGDYQNVYLKGIRLALRPLSSLTKPINWGLQTYEFTSLFEIGDDGGFIYDFGNGNTKLINDLESIAKYNSCHDINYLPYPVVKLMYEYHFDVHGLIPSGHAIELKEVDNG